MVCDSNIIIYAVDPTDTYCAQYVQRPDACIASITRIEVLGFPRFDQLEAERQKRLAQLVSSLPEMGLDEEVIQRAISLRRDRKMSLADSIIAATALQHQMSLVTRNIDDYKHVQGLTLINPFPIT
jgi:predicted nucleic acid-binding protein